MRYVNGHAILDYMLPPAEQKHITEDYVSSPPALTIFDETGAVWTLSNDIADHKWIAPSGEFCFTVLRNGFPTGERASRIERRSGKIRIFTVSGWKRWTGKSFF
jgi:hypothetical protein